MDMFQSRFAKEGLFSPIVGMDYRTKVTISSHRYRYYAI